jgi:SET domain
MGLSSPICHLFVAAYLCLSGSSIDAFRVIHDPRTRFVAVTATLYRRLPTATFVLPEIPPRSEKLDSLTCDELASRFKDVLAYFTSVPPGDPAVAHFTDSYTPQLSLLRGRLSDLHLNRCQILPSSIEAAGNGLFATRDIKEGELITIFPADAILFRSGELEEICGVMYGKNRTPESLSLTDDAARSYEIRISSIHSIVGDPSLTNDAAYLGHIANDGACLTAGDDVSRTIYSAKSAEAANAVFRDIHEGCHMGLFSSRPISSGEEIFVSYGEGYWLSRCSNEVFREAQLRDEERRRRLEMAQTKTKNSKGKSKGKKGKSPRVGRGF